MYFDAFFYIFLVDGEHPSLAFATTGGKVVIHSPHISQDASKQE